MTQVSLKLVESEPDPLVAIMANLRAKKQAESAALESSLSPIVDEIELVLGIESGELDDARRLRRLAKLREEAALQHAIRIGRLLLRAKAEVPHGQFQQWVEKHFRGPKTATEYMRIARTRRRA